MRVAQLSESHIILNTRIIAARAAEPPKILKTKGSGFKKVGFGICVNVSPRRPEAELQTQFDS